MTATREQRPFLAGFCGPTMPTETHRLCAGAWKDGPPCNCGCHGLTAQHRDILDLEGMQFNHAAQGTKEPWIREVLDLKPTRYYQILNSLLDRPEALAYSPVVVNALRKRRATPKWQRGAA